MRIIVDTSVWSLVLRRRPGSLSPAQQRTLFYWRETVRDRRAIILGLVRQEVLSGIKDSSVFDRIADYLRGFEDFFLDVGDYEQAARCACVCQKNGIAFTAVDMLICGASLRNDLEIMTVDLDFSRYARLMPLRLTQMP